MSSIQQSTHSAIKAQEAYVPSYQPPRLSYNPSPDIVKPTSIHYSNSGNFGTYSFQGKSNTGESFNPIINSGGQPINFSQNIQQQQQSFTPQMSASLEYDQLKKAGRVSTNYGDDQQQNQLEHLNNKLNFTQAQFQQLMKDNNDKDDLIRQLKADLYSANYVNGQRFSQSENNQFNQAEIEKLRRLNAELNQDNTSLAQIIQQKSKGLDNLNNENEENKLKATNLEIKLKQQIAESDRLRGLVNSNSKISINDENSINNSSTFNNIQNFKFQNDTLSNQLKLKEAKIDELSAQVRQLEILLQQKEQESVHLKFQPELENLKRQLRESQIINDKMIQEEQIRRANLIAEENARREKEQAEEQVKRGKHEQIDQLTIENINLTNQLKIMSQDSRDYAERCDNYQAKLRVQEEEKTKLLAQIKSLEEEKLRQQLNQTFLKGIEDDVARLQVQLRGSEDEKARLLQQIRASDEEKLRLQGEIRKIEDEKFKISSQIKGLEEDKQTLQNKFKSGDDERARLQILLKLAEEDKVRLQNQLKTLQDEKIQSQLYPKQSDEDITRLKAQLKNSDEQISNLNLKVLGLEQDKARLQSNEVSLENEKSRLNSLLRLAEDEKNRLYLERGQNKGLSQETELNSKILDLTKQLQAKDNELLRFNGFEPRFIELEAQNKDLIQKVNNLQATNSSLQSHSRKASTVVVNEYLSSPNIHSNTALPTQTDTAHWKKQYDNMHARSVQLCEQLEEIQRIVYLKQTQIIGLENQLGLLQQDMDNQVKLYAELQKQKATVSPSENAALNSEIANLNQQIVNLKSENNNLKTELDNLRGQSQEVIALRSELSELKIKALNTPTQSEIQGLEAQIAKLQLAYQQKDEELNLARSSNRISTPNNHGFILDLQEKEQEVQDLKTRLAQYADRNAELSTQVNFMQNKNQQQLFNDEDSLYLSQNTNKDQVLLWYRKENKRLDQELQELKNHERVSLRENYGGANKQRGCNYGC